MLTDSFLVREKAARKTLINQSDRYRRTVVSRGKCAPLNKWNAQGSKVVSGHQAVLNCERLIRFIYGRAPCNGECTRMSTHGGWKLASRPDGYHSGQRCDPCYDLCVKRSLFCRLGIRVFRQVEPRRENVLALKARIHLE